MFLFLFPHHYFFRRDYGAISCKGYQVYSVIHMIRVPVDFFLVRKNRRAENDFSGKISNRNS